MTTVLVTGARGQVGFELMRTLMPLGQVYGPDRTHLDLADPDSIRRVVRALKPSVIVNPAAHTAVDQAEGEPELAMRVNGAAPGVLAEEARRLGAFLVHYSTDYVFDGKQTRPYVESDPPHPLNVYGQSKLAGERAVAAVGADAVILRTSWVYGLRGRNFLTTMRRLAAEGHPLRVVADQVGAPTWSRAIAEATALIVRTALSQDRPTGLFHLCAEGAVSWHGFASAILGADPGAAFEIAAITTDDYPRPARRPRYSALSCERLATALAIGLPPWQEMLALALASDSAPAAHPP